MAHVRGVVHRAPPARPIYSFLDLLTCSLLQHALDPSCMPDPVLGARDAAVNTTDRAPVLMEPTLPGDRATDKYNGITSLIVTSAGRRERGCGGDQLVWR